MFSKQLSFTYTAADGTVSQGAARRAAAGRRLVRDRLARLPRHPQEALQEADRRRLPAVRLPGLRRAGLPRLHRARQLAAALPRLRPDRRDRALEGRQGPQQQGGRRRLGLRHQAGPPLRPYAPGSMAVMVDKLVEYAHVKLPFKHWCHMASDVGFEELHAFAAQLGHPPPSLPGRSLRPPSAPARARRRVRCGGGRAAGVHRADGGPARRPRQGSAGALSSSSNAASRSSPSASASGSVWASA